MPQYEEYGIFKRNMVHPKESRYIFDKHIHDNGEKRGTYFEMTEIQTRVDLFFLNVKG